MTHFPVYLLLDSSSSVNHSVMFNCLQPHELGPARLLCPWDSPGKNTGVDCHSFSRESSWPRDWTQGSCIADRFFTIWATGKILLDEPPHLPLLTLTACGLFIDHFRLLNSKHRAQFKGNSTYYIDTRQWWAEYCSANQGGQVLDTEVLCLKHHPYKNSGQSVMLGCVHTDVYDNLSSLK